MVKAAILACIWPLLPRPRVSVAAARIGREMLFEFVGDTFPLLGVRRWHLFGRYIRPNLRIFSIDAEPLFQARLGVRLDRFNRTLRLAYAAIDAFVRVNDQHVLALVKTIDGANLNAVHVFAFDAIVVDDIGHLHTLDARFEALLLSHGSGACKKAPAAR